MKHLRYIATYIILLTCLCTQAAPATIKARLDSAQLIMGRTTTLHLEVVKDRSTAGYFPMFTADNHHDYVTLLDDTIELSRKFTSDTVDLGAGRMQINYRVPLQAFDSGFYQLPAIEYVAGVDTVQSNRVALKVLPIDAKATDEIAGYTDVADGEPLRWHDRLPDWIVDYWWLLLIIIIVIGGVIALYVHYRRTGKILPKFKPTLSPYEKAMQDLQALKAKELWQKGDVEAYFVQLIDILRAYIDKRFNVSAPEMTTQQFLAEASHNEKLSAFSSQLSRLLELADYVKFAQMQALPDENEEAFAIVRDFITSTRPTQEEEESRKSAEKEAHRNKFTKNKGKNAARKKSTVRLSKINKRKEVRR